MDTVLLQILKEIFKQFPQFWSGENLQRSLVIDAIQKKDPQVIKALIANEKVKSIYGTDIDDVLIFDFDKLVSLLKYKEYWADSFTKYRNKVGLTSEGKYLNYSSDFVLDFPFKDCVLEGGMTKENQGKNEVYYNEVIARDEIDRLFSPKVFSNSKRYIKNRIEENINQFNDDNLIIQGNNLIALHSLKERYAGKIKLIYIDPPYNTGGDSFKYNDRFNHSTWLTFMKNRLEIAKDLLKEDGVIFVSLDDNESHYCKVLMDDIFGRENFIADICHKSRASISNDKIISANHNNILFFAKNERVIFSLKEKIGIKKSLEGFNLSDDKGDYKLVPVDGPGGASKGNPYYEFLGVSGYWRFSQKRMQKMYEEGLIVKTVKGLQQKYYKEKAALSKQTVSTWWDEGFLTSSATSELKRLMEDDLFKNPKNENLLKRIIEISTEEEDIVLDYHLGSGTTCAVAHKMGRRYIGIEQMDYINEITVPRLQKVIEGEQGGISKDVSWQGGGSFVYTELMELNYIFIHHIEQSKSTEDLLKIFEVMKSEAHLNYQIALDKVLGTEYEIDGVDHFVSFNDLDLSEQKKLLIEVLDKNQLYVNASEMDDKTLKISESEKAFTKSFYQKDC